MADTSIGTGHALRVQQWDNRALKEYLDKLVLKPYMGKSDSSPIIVKERLIREAGDRINIPFRARLSGAGQTGDSTLEGNEESMNFYNHALDIDMVRHAVRDNGRMTRKRTELELREEFSDALTSWLAQKWEDDAFLAMHYIDGTAYASASEAEKDAWVANNSDRVLFGNATGNYSASDHSASLGAIDSTNDTFDGDIITLLKRIAKLADPKIRPLRLEDGSEIYVCFEHPYVLRDWKSTDDYKNAQRDARERGLKNPIFTGADSSYDGVMLVETEKCPILAGVGASSIDVGVGFLLGGAALGYGVGGFEDGSRVKLIDKDFDYGNKQGLAIQSLYGIEKLQFNSKDNGVLTHYMSAVAD